MSEMKCPNCNIALSKKKIAKGIVFSCTTCHGLSITYGLLANAFERKQVAEIWRNILAHGRPGTRKCPACQKLMKTIDIGLNQAHEFDVCIACQVFWFDQDELNQLKLAAEPEKREALLTSKSEILSNSTNEEIRRPKPPKQEASDKDILDDALNWVIDDASGNHDPIFGSSGFLESLIETLTGDDVD